MGNNQATNTPSEESDDHGLKNDFHRLYHERSMSDFQLCVNGKKFPVHHSLLLARSLVFQQMFTSKPQVKTLVLDDLDEETLSKMLEYLYTDDVSQMTVADALKLYYAGDKYEIGGLKSKSRNFLKQNITTQNVYEILELADRHDDSKLKVTAFEFVMQHEKDVTLSKVFEEFAENHLRLTVEMMIHLSKLRFNKTD